MSLIGGYMTQTVGWRWFCWLCAMIGGVNVLGFVFFFPETRFEREDGVSAQAVEREVVTVDKGISEKHQVLEHVETHTEVELVGDKKSYWQSLDPTPKLSKSFDVTSLFLRPYALFAYPAVFWATVACRYSCSKPTSIMLTKISTTDALIIAWVIAASTMTSFIFRAPPYNFSAGTLSLINIASILGNLVGSYSGGYLTDIWVQRLARKQGGVFRAETRLMLLILPAMVVPAGLLIFGLGAQFGVHWAVVFVGEIACLDCPMLVFFN